MNVELRCSDKSLILLTQILKSKGFNINKEGNLAVVEKDYELSENCINIVFDINKLDELINLIDKISLKRSIPDNIIVGKKSDRYEIIKFDKIMYFESSGNDLYCFSHNGKYQIKNKLYEIEEGLIDKGFIRISKSVVVNIIAIAEILPWFNSKFILKLENNTKLEVSKSYSKNFRIYLGI